MTWLTIPMLEGYLSISKVTIYRLIYKKEIPFHKLGKLYRFNKNEIDEWLLAIK